MIGTSTYVICCIVCFHVFLKYRCLLYQLRCVFTNQMFIKWVVVIVNVRLKEKSVLCENLVSIMYWGSELILSPIRMWLPPQPYRWYSFGCRYTWCGWRPRSFVLRILWLELDTTVVMWWTTGCPFFCVFFVYDLWHLCHLFIVKSFFCYIYIFVIWSLR